MRTLAALFLAAQVALAAQVPPSLQQAAARSRAELRSKLNSIQATPVSALGMTAKDITPAVAADGYFIMALYDEMGGSCDGAPFAYTTLKQSYCYKGENGGTIQYTCVEDSNTGTVNATMTKYNSKDCTGAAAAMGEMVIPANTCTEGNITYSCTADNDPWVGADGTLQFEYASSSCKDKDLYGFTLYLDGCMSIGGDSIDLTCEAGSGTSYDYYAGSDTCTGGSDGMFMQKFSTCKKVQEDDDWDDDDEYYDDDTFAVKDFKTYLVSCCATDDAECDKNNKGGEDDEENVCFAASEMVTTPEGHKAISDVTVGDVVLTMTAEGTYKFADVVYVPHAANAISSAFITLTTPTTSLKATPKHLIPAAPCSAESFPLMAMDEVPVGYCVMTVQNGKQPVVESGVSQGAGVYTIVTSESNGHIVVNDVVASSFGINHAVANTYYNLHRMVYQVAPWFSKSSVMQQINMMVGDAVLSM